VNVPRIEARSMTGAPHAEQEDAPSESRPHGDTAQLAQRMAAGEDQLRRNRSGRTN
jgi:hypothetical protein